MAANSYGFIQKKYRQPMRYDEIFGRWCAIYSTNSGKEIMVEAGIYFSNRENTIDHYNILLREPDHRRELRSHIPSQKKAIELLEIYITNL